jgi:hypothetical protein
MKKNVNTVDAIVRITVGLTGVAWGTARMVHQPHRSFPMVVTMLSAMKVAEGVTRFCPMLALFNTSSREVAEDVADMADMANMQNMKDMADKAMQTPMVKRFTAQEKHPSYAEGHEHRSYN